MACPICSLNAPKIDIEGIAKPRFKVVNGDPKPDGYDVPVNETCDHCGYIYSKRVEHRT